jgi:hypothetical protein
MKPPIFLMAGILVLTLAGGAQALAQNKEHPAELQHSKMSVAADSAKLADVLYQCPMDPEVVSSKPGKCPKCGMKLQKVSAQSVAPLQEASADTTAAEAGQKKHEETSQLKQSKRCCSDEAEGCDQSAKGTAGTTSSAGTEHSR